jgi:hypothetical protein
MARTGTTAVIAAFFPGGIMQTSRAVVSPCRTIKGTAQPTFGLSAKNVKLVTAGVRSLRLVRRH